MRLGREILNLQLLDAEMQDRSNNDRVGFLEQT